MPETVNGLPVHPLVVHFVVVLLVLGVLGTVGIALSGALRARYGALVALVTAAGTALVPVATQSGERLEETVGDPGVHAEYGDQLLAFALPLALLCLLLVALDTRGRRTGRGTRRGGPARRGRALRVVAALCLVAALATGWQVYRVGDSGAQEVWGDLTTASSR